ncbi:AMP-binding protein [Fodinicola acaciae]|uniref:AMP-binding protein n=1 Tax=Fodinicola acaciae TaxID=2681555 RepID=UPI001FE460AB|nr:AMP-binding protein [Fodinicola acaciae]
MTTDTARPAGLSLSPADARQSYGDLILRALSGNPDRAAFAQDGRILSYRAAKDVVLRTAAALAERGIGNGTPVGMLGPNRAELWLAQAAAWIRGARTTGLHPANPVDTLLWFVRDAGLRVLIVDPLFARIGAILLERSETLRSVLTLGPASAGDDLLSLSENASPDPAARANVTAEDVAWLHYTGGTTGAPKGVLTSHRAMVFAQTATAPYAIPEQPRHLAVASIVLGGSTAVLPVLLRGGTIFLQRYFHPDTWLRAIQHDRISFAVLTPEMIGAILDRADPESYDLTSLRTIVYGAAPIRPERIREAIRRIGPVFTQIYGQTEHMSPISHLTRKEHDPVRRPHLLASCGRIVDGVESRIVGEDGSDVSGDEVGEIWIRSPAAMSGYWNRCVDPGGTDILRTGDLARRDDDGYLYLVGRRRDRWEVGTR